MTKQELQNKLNELGFIQNEKIPRQWSDSSLDFYVYTNKKGNKITNFQISKCLFNTKKAQLELFDFVSMVQQKISKLEGIM